MYSIYCQDESIKESGNNKGELKPLKWLRQDDEDD